MYGGGGPIRSRYLGHVTGYRPIRDQYFLIQSVPVTIILPNQILAFFITPRDFASSFPLFIPYHPLSSSADILDTVDTRAVARWVDDS